jgi:hypothetical protein
MIGGDIEQYRYINLKAVNISSSIKLLSSSTYSVKLFGCHLVSKAFAYVARQAQHLNHHLFKIW